MAGRVPARAGDQQDDEQVEQRPLPLGEQVAPREEEQGRQSDRHDGEQVAVP